MADLDIAETAKRIALTDRGIYPACLEGARGDCEMCADMAARIASAIQAERDRADELDHLASVRRADLARALRERDEWQANAENAVRALEAAAKPRTCLHCRHFQMAPECKTWNTEPEDFRYGRCIVRLGDDVDICTNREGHVEEVAIMRTSFGCGAFEEKGGDDE